MKEGVGHKDPHHGEEPQNGKSRNGIPAPENDPEDGPEKKKGSYGEGVEKAEKIFLPFSGEGEDRHPIHPSLLSVERGEEKILRKSLFPGERLRGLIDLFVKGTFEGFHKEGGLFVFPEIIEKGLVRAAVRILLVNSRKPLNKGHPKILWRGGLSPLPSGEGHLGHLPALLPGIVEKGGGKISGNPEIHPPKEKKYRSKDKKAFLDLHIPRLPSILLP